MQILYQMDITKDYSLEHLAVFLENFDFADDEIIYIKKTLPQIISNMETIDEIISKHLEGWSINRLAKVDKEILRVAVYEFLFREDIPKEVSINEAIEISKEYGGKDSFKFINGILGSIYRNMVE